MGTKRHRAADLAKHNIPAPLSPLIGRQREIREIRRLLRGVRLLTLVGTAGAGKTRLASAAAARAVSSFPDGVWWVELAPLANPALVPTTVMATVGVRERPGREATAALTAHFRTRHVLLILDNCEHLLEAAAGLLATLLRACPSLTALTTSREPLGIPGETTWQVPPLGLPDAMPDDVATAEMESGAVRLFAERARASNPAFHLTPSNAACVVRICRALDGLPLAIELAASRTRGMPVQEIEAHLGQRLDLLAGRLWHGRPQHRTLRAALDWSYVLLSESERHVLRSVSVFAGSFLVDAAQAVCNAGPGVLGDLVHLVDRSLVVPDPSPEGEARYRLLDTIRAYGWERLTESSQIDDVRVRMLRHYLSLTDDASSALRGPKQQQWLGVLSREYPNIRAALDWAMRSDPEALLQMAGNLWRFWNVMGLWQEGREWLDRALERGPHRLVGLRGWVSFGAGVLSWYQEDYAAADRYLQQSRTLAGEADDTRLLADSIRQLALVASGRQEHAEAWELASESLRLFEQIGDPWGIAAASRLLGYHASGSTGNQLTDRLDVDLALRHLERSLQLARSLGDTRGVATTLVGLARVSRDQGQPQHALTYNEEALTLFKALGDRAGIETAVGQIARLTWMAGDLDRASTLAFEALSIAREMDDIGYEGHILHLIATIKRDQGDPDTAGTLDRQALQTFSRLGNAGGIAGCLQGLGELACRRRRWKQGARLLAAATATRAQFHIVLPPFVRSAYTESVATVRRALGETPFEAAWQSGLALTLQEAIADGLRGDTPMAGAPVVGGAALPLSEREREVAALVAQGLSNAQIAQTLLISRRTADSHLQHILTKLGFHSRAQIAAWAVANQLQNR